MPLNTVLFAVSLLLLAIFFALKEREVYKSKHALPTRLLIAASPFVERLWQASRGYVLTLVTVVIRIVGGRARLIVTRLGVTARYLIVVLAEKMIKGVKGERLLSMRGGASVYLKHLKEEGGLTQEGNTSPR